MKPQFDVQLVRLAEVHELPGAWPPERYLQLLHVLEFYDTDELSADDLAEMTIMALQDAGEPIASAEKVVEVVFGDATNKGVRQKLVHDMQDERAWEEHGDMMLHARIFTATGILNRAFPALYPTPTIARLTLDIDARNGEAGSLLAQPPTAAFLTRLLASGMDDHSALRRLFATQLAGDHFPEAAAIVWHMEPEELHQDGGHASRRIVAYVPLHWIGALKSIKQFEAAAHFDAAA